MKSLIVVLVAILAITIPGFAQTGTSQKSAVSASGSSSTATSKENSFSIFFASAPREALEMGRSNIVFRPEPTGITYNFEIGNRYSNSDNSCEMVLRRHSTVLIATVDYGYGLRLSEALEIDDHQNFQDELRLNSQPFPPEKVGYRVFQTICGAAFNRDLPLDVRAKFSHYLDVK